MSEPSDNCCVDDCDRRAAASVASERHTGLLTMCAVHTEDFRLNGAGWMIAWDDATRTPTSVQPAARPAIGRNWEGPAGAPVPTAPRVRDLRTRLDRWRRSRL